MQPPKQTAVAEEPEPQQNRNRRPSLNQRKNRAYGRSREPTAEPEPEELAPEDMNVAFDSFLAGMEKYNTISLEDTNCGPG